MRMEGLELSDDALMAALRAHPELRKRVSSIVLAVEGDKGELTEADAAEERLVEEMRLLGREALHSWAETRVEATEREIRQRLRCIARVKKTPLAYEIRRNRNNAPPSPTTTTRKNHCAVPRDCISLDRTRCGTKRTTALVARVMLPLGRVLGSR